MNQAAHDAIEHLWTLTVKSRALCPYTPDFAVGIVCYPSPSWYRQQGAAYVVNLATPLSEQDARELRQIGEFINRSFIVSMFATLQEFKIVPYDTKPDRSRPGGDHVQLTKRLRNHFAHGDWTFDANKPKHCKTWNLLKKLFPSDAGDSPGFHMPIDTILEPLKESVLQYITSFSNAD